MGGQVKRRLPTLRLSSHRQTLHGCPVAVRLAFIPPAQPVFAGFGGAGGEQRAVVDVGLDGVDGKELPVAAAPAAFDPHAVMAVFGEVDADDLVGCAGFRGGGEIGVGTVGVAGGGDDAEVSAYGFGIAGVGLEAGDLGEQPGQDARRARRGLGGDRGDGRERRAAFAGGDLVFVGGGGLGVLLHGRVPALQQPQVIGDVGLDVAYFSGVEADGGTMGGNFRTVIA